MSKERLEKNLSKFGELCKAIWGDESDYPDSVSFLSFEVVEDENLLTPAKIRLLLTLKENEVSSVSELADLVGRAVPNVSNDCRALEGHGLLEIEKDGKRKIPHLAEDHLIIVF